MKRRTFIASGILAAQMWQIPVLAQVHTAGDAINKSGRQRMLAQRMAKAYCQLGLRIDTEHAQKILDQSLALFDRQLTELRAFAPTSDIQKSLATAESGWSEYKQLLVGRSANKADAKTILTLSDKLMQNAEEATTLFEKWGNDSGGKWVNLAGRERMLSQRLSKCYFALLWDVATPDANAVLANARKEFVAALSTLSSAPVNTQAIRDELTLAQQQWLFFDQALQRVGEDKIRQQAALNVATSSERILEQMDKVTALYQRVA